MKLNYNGLWKRLIDKNMNKKDLREMTGISSTTIAKMTKGEPVNLRIVALIALKLDTDIGELVSLDKDDFNVGGK